MTTALALGKDTHRFIADPSQAMYGLMQAGRGHRLRKADVDDHFRGWVDLFLVVGLRLGDGRAQAEAGLAPAWRGSLSTHQGIMFALGKMLLHLLAYAPVLPPIKYDDNKNQHHAQKNQTDLQVTHCQPRRITKRLPIPTFRLRPIAGRNQCRPRQSAKHPVPAW